MTRILLCAGCLVWVLGLVPTPTLAEAAYDDVAVVINTASISSMTIGQHFAASRGVPQRNMIYVNVSTDEEIDDLEFSNLRNQIESHLQAHNLVDAVNYIVTTKGVPLKVYRGDTYSLASASSSVESELMCLMGSYASLIGGPGRSNSPYWNSNAPFTHAAFGIYLVTRLDGYSIADVLALIDRSGPSTLVHSDAAFVLDQDPGWNGSASYLNDYLTQARSLLAARGKNVELNSDTVFVTSRPSVLGYVSWGSNDHHADKYTQFAIPKNSWAPGALAETYVSTSARSFTDPPEYGQSLIADLIREGASGAKGYVYEPFSSAMANPAILFDRYADGFNLAESYFMASKYLSWMDVVIGDPKTSITEDPAKLPVQLASFCATFDPMESALRLTWSTLSELNNYGFIVQIADTASMLYKDIPQSFVPGNGTTLVPQHYAWTTHAISPGVWCLRLRQIDMDATEHFSEAQRVHVGVSVTSVDEHRRLDRLRLDQNYPNPFNPTTTIRYAVGSTISLSTLGAGDHSGTQVRLAVYDIIGREVALLVDEQKVPGHYSVTFEGEGLPSGTYYYSLTVGQTRETRTMLLLK